MLTLLLSLLALAACGEGGSTEPFAVGASAPKFSLKALDGTTVTSASLKGSAVVLNFWATYCQPCRTEIPELNEVAATSGAKVIGISLDADGAETVRRFELSENLQLKYTVLLGDEEVFQRYDGVGIPYTVVLDRSQRVVNVYRGPVSKEALRRDLAKIDGGAAGGQTGGGF